MCGGEVRAADQAVVDQFIADHDGVTVNMEAVPWGTCQDKSLTLAAAGDPPSISYMGSRTLRQLANNDLIVPVEISAEAAGRECVAPTTWDEMYDLAKAIDDNTEAAGVCLAGKDFDNTMHQFLNYLYSNGGTVIDPATGANMLDSAQTREALEYYGKLVEVAQEGPTAWEGDQIKDQLNDGKIGMYISGPWGRGQHNADINQMVAPVPHGPSGQSGTILITDSLVVFKRSGHEALAQELAQALSSGASQYDFDSSWGLTPIMQWKTLAPHPSTSRWPRSTSTASPNPSAAPRFCTTSIW